MSVDTEYNAQFIGHRLRQRREELSMSQGKLSRRSDVALNTIRQIEQGQNKPKVETLLKLMGALEIPRSSLLEILGLTDEEEAS